MLSKNFNNGLILFISLAIVIFSAEWFLDFAGVKIPWFITLSNYYYIAIKVGVMLLTVRLGVLMGWVFWQNKIFKYRLSEIAGIIGIIVFIISMGLLLFFPIFIWFFLLAGLLCLYAVIVPVFNVIYERMGGNKWEAGAVFAVVSFALLYYMGYKSNIRLNEIFAVDPKHFPFTKTIASIVQVAPAGIAISLIAMLSFYLASNKKRNIADHDVEKSDAGRQLFLSFNGIFASLILLVLSIALTANGDAIIKNSAATMDFNARSVCQNVEAASGVIYLDNKYELILIDQMVKEQHRYTVSTCTLPKA